MIRKLILLLYVFTLFLTAAFAQSESTLTTVILVRHAEKSTTPKENPILTDAGKLRAEHLAKMLSNAAVQAIYTSQYQRTKQTAEPIANKLGIQTIVLDAAKSDGFAKSIRTQNAGQIVLVVGHSNTIPEIILALGGPAMEELDEREYDNFFVLTMPEKGESSLLKLKYD